MIKNKTISLLKLNQVLPEQFIIYSLEEFEEKFPYKVGDKVYYKPIPQINSVCISEIISMRWIDGSVVYYTSNCHEVYACDLQPYKEETIEESIDKTNKVIFETNVQSCDISNEIIKKDVEEIKIDIPNGYEFFGIDDDNKIVLAEKQPQYPKTYKECCKVLNTYCTMPSRPGYKEGLIAKFQELLICRDAYWKLAGEEMELDKPWKYDMSKDEFVYAIVYQYGYIQKCEVRYKNHILAFPTPEMRDAFFDNFKDLIEQCKELL